MTQEALPELEKYGYDSGLATGVLAAGGTLGIMIPPSIALLLYAIMTEQSVGDMFTAGLIPGLLDLLMYTLTAVIVLKFHSKLADKGTPTTNRQKLVTLTGLMPFAFLFATIIFGIYFALFTPTKGAAVEAFFSCVYAMSKKIGRKN